MSYTVASLKSDVIGTLHNTVSNQITNFNGLIYRAARQVLLDCDPQETKRILPLSTSVFNSVYDYASPTDLKGNRVIDIFPQVNRQLWDQYFQQYNQTFDIWKTWSCKENFTVLFNTAIKTLRLNAPQAPATTLLNAVDAVSDNGTWATGGQASGIVTDNVTFAANNGSVSFNLSAGSAGSTGYLENSTMTSVNLSSLLNQGTIFLYVYLPTATDFNNIILRWGSSSSNYYQVTATQTQSQTTFQNGWNLIAFPWLGATVVGSPNASAITYLRVTYTYDGNAQTAVRLNEIFASLGMILNIEYYSKYMFRTSAGVFQETVTDDSNLINLDTESYNLLLYQCCLLAVQQQQGLDASFYDGPYFTDLYAKCLARYNQLYRSEVTVPVQSYYTMTIPRRNIGPRTRNW